MKAQKNHLATAGQGAKSLKEKSDNQLTLDFIERAKSRLGQNRFRNGLLDSYGRKCAVTRSSVEECLSAAHILEYSKGANQEVTNGILLRADSRRRTSSTATAPASTW